VLRHAAGPPEFLRVEHAPIVRIVAHPGLDLTRVPRDDLRMLTVHINGTPHETDEGARNLLSFIRFDARLTGTKYGCGEGLCGACTVLVDGQPLRACTTTVAAVAGGSITTIEGLADGGKLHPVQEAFIEESAMQCGYCIPGFIMTSVALLNRDPRPNAGQVREALAQNMCRCGTYQRILRAVENASNKMAGAG
jgi:aerobic-type carbon monoxide dehydrogenase small subunit (CoxS/CutS family)